MKNYLFAAILLVAFNTTAQQQNTPPPFTTKWDNGFKIDKADGSMKMKFGGRIMYDASWSSLDEDAEDNGYELKSRSGNEFRRIRFFNSGTIYNNVDYKLQIDFAGGKVVVKDAFITLKKLPLIGNLRAGHFKDPIRLEAIASSKYNTFIERATAISLFNERNVGFMAFDFSDDKKVAWQVAVLRNATSASSDSPEANGDYSITARIAGKVIDTEKNLLHLGIGNEYRKREDNTFGYSVRPEIHISNKYLKTGFDDVDGVNITNLEAVLISKRFSLQGEYALTGVKRNTSKTNLSASYAQASLFLTEDTRGYKDPMMGFDRVKPTKNFGDDGGMGALEFAVRYSEIDGTGTDKMKGYTAGLNWYLNPATRIQANYVLNVINNATQYTGDAQFKAFVMRFQVDF